MDCKCLYPHQYRLPPCVRTSSGYLRETCGHAICNIHLPCRKCTMYRRPIMGDDARWKRNRRRRRCQPHSLTEHLLTFIAAGCFVMTKIIMSDTNSLRENSTQNTFLALMFAVAYSIGPVRLSLRCSDSRSSEVFLHPFPGDGVSG
jgi:hypothetical protein